MWKYLIPIGILISFVTVSSFNKYYLIFPILLIANILNIILGEFNQNEIVSELKDFYTSKHVILLKRLSAVLLVVFVLWSIYYFYNSEFSLMHIILFTIAVGCLTGCFCLTLSHDLSHSAIHLDRILAAMLLLVSCSPYLAADHIYSHHIKVGLREDVSTAKKGQSLYHFYFVNAIDRLKNSFTNKLQFATSNWLELRKQNIILMVLFLILAITIFLTTNFTTLVFFLAQGWVAYSLYEIINYIQHYGLVREKATDKIGLAHSWNCYYKYTNYILYMLPLHSLHHLPEDGINIKIEDLKKGPKMHYLYFIMVAMALIPSLWYAKMDKLSDAYNNKE